MARPKGATLPGSLTAWFTAAKVGDVYWTETESGLAVLAKRAGRKIETRRFSAVSAGREPELTAVRLIRVQVVA